MTTSRQKAAIAQSVALFLVGTIPLVSYVARTASTERIQAGHSSVSRPDVRHPSAYSLIQHSTKKELSAELSLFFALFRQTPPHTQVPVAKSTKPVPPVTATRSTATT